MQSFHFPLGQVRSLEAVAPIFMREKLNKLQINNSLVSQRAEVTGKTATSKTRETGECQAFGIDHVPYRQPWSTPWLFLPKSLGGYRNLNFYKSFTGGLNVGILQTGIWEVLFKDFEQFTVFLWKHPVMPTRHVL